MFWKIVVFAQHYHTKLPISLVLRYETWRNLCVRSQSQSQCSVAQCTALLSLY